MLAFEAAALAPLLECDPGASALHLRPCQDAPELPSGARTRLVTTLFRERGGQGELRWSGDLRSVVENLPLREGSVELIVAWHVLADAQDRGLLATELHRVLAPEGALWLVEFDPWSACWWTFGRRGLPAWTANRAGALMRASGFHLQRQCGIGRRWPFGAALSAKRVRWRLPMVAQTSFALKFVKREAAGTLVGMATA